MILCWTPTEKASRPCLALAEKADKRWFTLDDSTAQFPDLHSEFLYVNITMSFYASPSTYGLAISILDLTLLSQPFKFFLFRSLPHWIPTSVCGISTLHHRLTYIHVHTPLTVFSILSPSYLWKSVYSYVTWTTYCPNTDFTHREARVLCSPCKSATMSTQLKKKKKKEGGKEKVKWTHKMMIIHTPKNLSASPSGVHDRRPNWHQHRPRVISNVSVHVFFARFALQLLFRFLGEISIFTRYLFLVFCFILLVNWKEYWKGSIHVALPVNRIQKCFLKDIVTSMIM